MSYYPLILGGAIPDWLEAPFQAIGSLFSGGTGEVIDILSSIILAPINMLLWLAFKTITIFTGIAYDVMLATLTVTPAPVDDYGADDANIVIFADPAQASPFYSMQQVIQNGIVPIALLLIMFGIVIVLFFRVFDVVVNFSFDGEKAQKRLLLAPILITLWVPLANLILAIAVGLTAFFAPGGPVSDGMTVDTIMDESDIDGLSGGDTVDVMTLLESVPNNDLGSDPVAFVTGEGVNTAISLIVGIYFGFFIIPVALIAMILAFVRIYLLYVLYVLGPVGIMMWAMTWRDIGDIGEKIVRYFVLFALFPVPAAITGTLMPVIAVGTEQAVLGSMEEILGSESSSSAGTDWIGTDNIIRGALTGTTVLVMGFTPWALVITVGKATALAGGAALAGTAVATGGTSMIASGAASMAGPGKVMSGAGSAGKGIGSLAKKGGGAARKKIEQGERGPDDLADNAVAGMAGGLASTAVSEASGARNRIRQGQKRAKAKKRNLARKEQDPNEELGRRERLQKSAFDSVDEMSSTAEELSEELGDVNKERIASAGASQISSGLRTFGFNNTADVMERSGEAYQSHKKRRRKIRNKKNKRKSRDADMEELVPSMRDEDNIGKEEMEFMERMTADNMDGIEAFVSRSDKLDYKPSEVFNDDGTFNRTLDEDIKRDIGGAAMREVHEAGSMEELEESLDPVVAGEVTDAVSFEPTMKNLMEQADEMDSVSREQVANGEFSNLEWYGERDDDDINPLTRENNWATGDEDFDSKKKRVARTNHNEQSSVIASSAVQSSSKALQGAQLTEDEIRDMRDAYEEEELQDEAQSIVKSREDMLKKTIEDYQELEKEEREQEINQIAGKVADEYDELVKEEVKHGEQLHMSPSISGELDNNGTRNTEFSGDKNINNADPKEDIEMDLEGMGLAEVIEKSVEQRTSEIRPNVGPDATLEAVLEETQRVVDEEGVIENAIDEETVERTFRESRYLDEADDPQEAIGKFKEAMAETASKQIDSVNENMATVTAQTINDMNEDRMDNLGDAIEDTFDNLRLDDVTNENGEVVADKVQELKTRDSVAIVEGALNQARSSVMEDIKQAADQRGYDNAERLVEEVNNMSAEEVTELQGTDLDDIMKQVEEVGNPEEPTLDGPQ